MGGGEIEGADNGQVEILVHRIGKIWRIVGGLAQESALEETLSRKNGFCLID
ncbi:hypothetical protein RRSWK_02012 [Rhodopirellula sp. SWK7]|nr:hypothetical protein RRSWK_02012 [Rhodopirellula sp. SWK7]